MHQIFLHFGAFYFCTSTFFPIILLALARPTMSNISLVIASLVPRSSPRVEGLGTRLNYSVVPGLQRGGKRPGYGARF